MAIHPLRFKADEITDQGIFKGIASAFGNVDDYGDIIAPGAFKGSLAEHNKNNTSIVMLRDHNPAEPVGRWMSIKETARGLEVIGKLTLAVSKAKETLELLRDGALTGLSIGFRTIHASKDTKTGARVLEQIDLREISIVSMPANQSARIIAVKAEEIDNKREFERFLRDAGFARERAKILSKGFRPAASAQREAGGIAVGELARAIRASAKAISGKRE